MGDMGDLGGLGGGGSPEADLGLPGGPGGGMGGGTEGLPGLEEATEDSGSIVTEKQGEHAADYVRPSQKGVKKASDYSFGEDPLGNKENNEKPRPGRAITHVWKNNSPLSLESFKGSGLLKNLQTYLDKTKTEKKELIREAQENGNKSLLDEDGILEE